MKLNRSEQVLHMDGKKHSPEECIRLAGESQTESQIETQTQIEAQAASPILLDLYQFLADWFSDSPFINVQTSGSTGVPKPFSVRKEQMIQSARLTCEFLQLKGGDTALLCMPLEYIAGKMMVVRALVAGLNLIVRTPSGHPLKEINRSISFAAMIPMQVYNSLLEPEEKKRLEQIGTLIIGGGAVDTRLAEEIRMLPGNIYSTYGMTETLSHIALRRLNGPDTSPNYQPFPSVDLSLSPEDTLIIHAPLVCDDALVTNDVAQLHPNGTFTILGRKDNIINTGGIKVQIEQVETLLHPYLHSLFAITSVPDMRLGEAIVLLLTEPDTLTGTHEILTDILPKYHLPQHVYTISSLPMTGSGKVDRAACKALAKQLNSSSEG